MIPALPISVFMASLLIATYLGLKGRWTLVLALVLITAAVFLYCMFIPKEGEGFEDIGYAIVAFLGCVPAGGGLLSGAITAWLMGRVRARRAQ